MLWKWKNITRETKGLKRIEFRLHTNPVEKKAGSNFFEVVRLPRGWDQSPASLRMNLREASSLRDFLNEHLK